MKEYLNNFLGLFLKKKDRGWIEIVVTYSAILLLIVLIIAVKYQ